MAIIIDIDHEGGNLNEYTSTVDPDGDELNATVGAALAGTDYGLAVTIDDTDAVYGVYTLGTANISGVVRARFYIDPNSLTMANLDQFLIARFNVTEGGNAFLLINIVMSASVYYIRLQVIDDAPSGTYMSLHSITDEPHYIEVKHIRSSGADDGSVQLWIDGANKQTISDIDNDTCAATFQQIQFGAVSGVDAGTSGTFYLDELVVRDDDTEIGPVVRTVNLTATGITTGAPIFETPTITQIHSLSATGILAGLPIFGTPTLAQVSVVPAVTGYTNNKHGAVYHTPIGVNKGVIYNRRKRRGGW